MGIQINYGHKFTQEERDYLRGRSFGYMVDENDRIYGSSDDEEPEAPAAEDHSDENDDETSDGDSAGQDSDDDDEDENEDVIDQDIADRVSTMTIAEIKKDLDGRKVDHKGATKHDELATILANVLQDERDGA